MFKQRQFGRRGGFHRSGQNSGRSFGGRRFAAPKPLNPMMFIRQAAPDTVESANIEHSFDDFDLSPVLRQNLQKNGFEKPTPIQDKALSPALSGSDVLGLADTGTGKTLVFILPILNKIISNLEETALVLAPTRELALQIREETQKLTIGTGIRTALAIGGADIRRQIDDLRRGPSILIGTPGRLKDLTNRGCLDLSSTKNVVLDEVDRMLDMGFVKDITHLLSLTNPDRQTLMFSATMDAKIEEITRRFQRNPLKVSINSGSSKNVEQNIIKVSGKAQKINKLCELLIQEEFKKVIIFGRTKFGVEDIGRDLTKAGFTVGAIHGNKRQSQRERVLTQFKSSEIRILIATDVAARGIDVKDISHVINFDQPDTYDAYIHRIGRTGRAGNKGFALTFVD